jgi:hypothetical protein
LGPLEVERDACAIAAAQEVYYSGIVAAYSVALLFEPVRLKLPLADGDLPGAELILRKAMQPF